MNLQSELTPARPVVVIVDDDPAVRNALTFSLQVEGFSVRAYASGAELLGELPLDSAGCLVIDYRMPEMNGLDLLVELRKRHIGFPAILVTTEPSAAVRECAAANGMAVIEKPLLGEALFLAIRAAVTRSGLSASKGAVQQSDPIKYLDQLPSTWGCAATAFPKPILVLQTATSPATTGLSYSGA